mmetsp:Transcript_28920/g.73120  ORF Transcript_28920/g.73120 Transcript_28920/m.73120 type:complete len:224 (+) Transcript_28920:1-672(+)
MYDPVSGGYAFAGCEPGGGPCVVVAPEDSVALKCAEAPRKNASGGPGSVCTAISTLRRCADRSGVQVPLFKRRCTFATGESTACLPASSVPDGATEPPLSRDDHNASAGRGLFSAYELPCPPPDDEADGDDSAKPRPRPLSDSEPSTGLLCAENVPLARARGAKFIRGAPVGGAEEVVSAPFLFRSCPSSSFPLPPRLDALDGDGAAAAPSAVVLAFFGDDRF